MTISKKDKDKVLAESANVCSQSGFLHPSATSPPRPPITTTTTNKQIEKKETK